MKLRIGDEILITAGKDKGRRGKIERIFPKDSSVLVPGVNIYKRHRKGIPAMNVQGGIIEFARPLRVGNVQLVCPSCKKQTRVGFKVLKDGEKVRICRKCEKQIGKKAE